MQINLTLLSDLVKIYHNKQAKDIEKYASELAIRNLLNDLPCGSGLDNGVCFKLHLSTPTKLIFTFGYHFLNENGYYDGWGQFRMTITPTFDSERNFQIFIAGKDRNQIKEYLYDLFYETFYTEPFTNLHPIWKLYLEESNHTLYPAKSSTSIKQD